jgi:two-component system response regulator RstA
MEEDKIVSETVDVNRVLLVEDDVALANMVIEFLQSHGYHVGHEQRGDRAVDRILTQQPDLVLLDVTLPGCDGLTVCRSIRSRFHGVIVILTAQCEESIEVAGFDSGADDYIVKPVRPQALLARMQYHLGREVAHSNLQEAVKVDHLEIDPQQRTAKLAGQEIDLTTAEFDLLHLLALNAGKTLSRQEIFQEILGIRYDGLDRSIDLRISRLRKKIGDDSASPRKIKSIRGVGYLLSTEL